MRLHFAVLIAAAAALAPASTSRARIVWPECLGPACSDPTDYPSYLFTAPGQLPNDYAGGEVWKFDPGTGMNIRNAWNFTTGRPDVRVAILDSGIKWNERELARKVWLNVAELPHPCVTPSSPIGRLSWDCDGDGAVSVDDFAALVLDVNGNGLLDGQDLIRTFSNGVDEDGNGYVDDIAGWDFRQNDNDPQDEVEYGHGTGEAGDQVTEADDGGGFPGVAPSSFFVPCKVADSFVGVDADFAEAVVYAVDNGADVVSEALGTITASAFSQQAIDYAYTRGVPLIASAADEQSRHHNYPANFDHTIWVNSIRNADGTFASSGNDYTVQNGCTNHGGRAWLAISSSSCSSEATGRSGGMTLLLVSHGKNLIERGLLSPHPELGGKPFSAEEVRQLYRRAAEDIDHSVQPPLAIPLLGSVVNNLLGAPPGFVFTTTNFPTQAGWDQFTGWGRPNLHTLLGSITNDTIPPEADLTGSLAWFDTIDPLRTPAVDVVGSAAAVRTGGSFDWTLEVGCGVQPATFSAVASGHANARIERGVLAQWSPVATATACGIDPLATPGDPDQKTVQLKLSVTDSRGNTGIDLRTLAIHRDPTLHFAPRGIGASGEASSALADVNRDGVQEIVLATGGGAVHVIRGGDGRDIPGFPVHTNAIPVHVAPGGAYATGAVAIPHEPIVVAVAADDLDGDGRIEIVAGSTEGRVYVWNDLGQRRAGFPVETNPLFSGHAVLDRKNDADPGIGSAPTLVDLDPPGTPGHGTLEILAGGLDGHLYAWRADGTTVAGFPVRLADRTKLDLDPVTGKATPKPGSNAADRLTKVLSSPAVADVDGDGDVEIFLSTNEEYSNDPTGFAADSALLQTLLQAGQLGIKLGSFTPTTTGRLYGVHHDGANHAGGAFLSGWPVKVPLMVKGLLPTVATGTPGSPAIADLTGQGRIVIAIFGAVGPLILFDPDGTPTLGTQGGKPRVLPIDFPNGGFPNVPASAGSGDAPFFGALGSAALGDITGDGLPEVVAPTGGIRALVDVAVPGMQEFGDHSITAWDPRTATLLPAFPRKMDDMQFLASPGLADVDGDGVAEVVQGSGAYLVHAYRANGSEPAGWPKFTHGWMIPAPTAGDVDGDGLVEIVASSREGKLYVWDTPGQATDRAIPWQGFARDRRNSGNLGSGVSATAVTLDLRAGLIWMLRSVEAQLRERMATATGLARDVLRRSLSAPALRLAVFAVDTNRPELTVALLPWIEGSLRTTPVISPLVSDLHAQFEAGLSRFVHAGASSLQCAPADIACDSAKRRIAGLVATGDALIARNLRREAYRAWSRATALILPSLPPQ